MATATSGARALVGFKGNGSCSRCSSSSSRRSSWLPMPTSGKGWKVGSLMATAAAPGRESVLLPPPASDPWTRSLVAAAFDLEKGENEEERRRASDSVTAEKLDAWIRESIGEIVRNTGGEAPFLMQIFLKGPSFLKIDKEAALQESWPSIKKTWNQDTSSIPDGVILVKQLDDDNEYHSEEEEEEEELDAAAETNNNNNSNSSECSKRWGLVVQGRGMDCSAASCYILNTCRVRSPAGFCTHFCLVRAKCFGDSFDKQLGKAWLQGR